MHENNVARDAEHQYFDIQREGSFWIAWFYTSAPYSVAPVKFEDPANTKVVKPEVKKRVPRKKKV